MTGKEFADSVTAVVLAFNGKHWLEACLPSLDGQAQVLVVDNGSSDDTSEFVRTNFPHVELVRFEVGLGFGAAYNEAIAAVKTPYVAIVNQDTTIDPDCISKLLEALESDPSIGIIAPTVLNPDRSVQDRGSYVDAFGFPVPVAPSDAEQSWEPFFVSGCMMLLRVSFFRQLHGFADYLGFFVEDVDLCWRTWQSGHRVVALRGASIIHYGAGSIPGGWMRQANLTSNSRTFYRERNTLAVYLQDLGLPALMAFVPRYIANSCFEASGLLLTGRFAGALQYARAYRELLSLLPRVLTARQRVQDARRVPDRALRRFFLSKHRKLELVLRHGLPVFQR